MPDFTLCVLTLRGRFPAGTLLPRVSSSAHSLWTSISTRTSFGSKVTGWRSNAANSAADTRVSLIFFSPLDPFTRGDGTAVVFVDHEPVVRENESEDAGRRHSPKSFPVDV